MLKTLLKKQLTEFFRGFFYDAKKNKARSKAATIGLIVLFAVLMFGFMGGTFLIIAGALASPLVWYGLDWLYFTFMSLIAIFVGVLGSVFSTYASLYLAKDNDLLLSLPVPVRVIVASRILGVYLMGLLFSSVVMIPALITYWSVTLPGPAQILGGIVLLLLISAIVLALGCVLGYGVARISIKLKNKSYITTAIALLFVSAYYYFYFQAQTKLQEFLENLETYADKASRSLGFLKFFGEVGEGKWLSMLLCAAVVFVLCALTWIVLLRSFTKIATANVSAAKAVYREKAAKERSLARTLLAKEMGRFTSSANYMLNCGLSSVLLLVAGIALLWKGGSLLTVLEMVFGPEHGFVTVLLACGICMVAGMNDMVLPSVSLEGRSLWILQSLPVAPWEVLKAKLSLQLWLTLPPILFCSVCAAIVLRPGAAEWLLLILLPVLAVFLGAFFGLLLGIKHATFTWTNEVVPIKQSFAVLVYLLASMLYSALLIGGYFLFGFAIGAVWYLAGAALLTAVLDVLLWQWLKTRGAARFAAL